MTIKELLDKVMILRAHDANDPPDRPLFFDWGDEE